jgi:hypothetical protein
VAHLQHAFYVFVLVLKIYLFIFAILGIETGPRACQASTVPLKLASALLYVGCF